MIDSATKSQDTNNQPEIVEDAVLENNPVSTQLNREEQFYRVMDAVDQYDCKLTNVADQMTQAMLSLAHIKFSNPYLLSSFSYKPTPALLRLETPQRTLKQQSSPKFIYSRIQQTQDSSYDQIQQLQEQDEIEKQMQQKIGRCIDSQNSFEQLICDRFNVMNNRRQVIDASIKFRKVLQSILQLIQVREGVIKNMKEMEEISQQKK